MSSPGLDRLRWSWYAPFYDAFVGFDGQRRRSIAHLALSEGERVLIVGAGTGRDLPLLPSFVSAVATDLTPAMLDRARRHARPGIEFRVMDGQALDFADASFDAAILHLILAVIPDAARCLAETARVVRPGGRIAVFDKFLADDERPGIVRALAGPFVHALGTDINRRLGEIVAGSGASLRPLWNEPAGLGGFFRIAGFERT